MWISVLLRDGDGYRLQGSSEGAAASVVPEPQARSIAHLRAARGSAVAAGGAGTR